MAVGTESNIWYAEDSGPEMENVETKWWTTKSGGGLVEFTGVSKAGTRSRQGIHFTEDILFRGDYYVCCMVQGYTGSFVVTKNQWIGAIRRILADRNARLV